MTALGEPVARRCARGSTADDEDVVGVFARAVHGHMITCPGTRLRTANQKPRTRKLETENQRGRERHTMCGRSGSPARRRPLGRERGSKNNVRTQRSPETPKAPRTGAREQEQMCGRSGSPARRRPLGRERGSKNKCADAAGVPLAEGPSDGSEGARTNVRTQRESRSPKAPRTGAREQEQMCGRSGVPKRRRPLGRERGSKNKCADAAGVPLAEGPSDGSEGATHNVPLAHLAWY